MININIQIKINLLNQVQLITFIIKFNKLHPKNSNNLDVIS